MSESTSSDNPAPGTDQARQEAELIGRIIQSEQKLSDYFTTIITKSVTDQLERRSVMRLRLIGVVVVSLLTVSDLRFLRNPVCGWLCHGVLR